MFVNPRESESKSPSAPAGVLSKTFKAINLSIDALLLHLLFYACGLGRESNILANNDSNP